MGQIAGHKRIDLLIAALAKLAAHNPDLYLLIVGNPNATQTTKDLTAQLRSQAQALGIAERVIFAGEAFNVAPYYELADIFVQASQHDAMTWFCGASSGCRNLITHILNNELMMWSLK